MAIQVASFLVPKNSNTWFVVEDKFIKGGLQVVADAVERDAMNPINLKAGMLVVTQTDNKLWQLAADKIVWAEFKSGGGGSGNVRKSTLYPILGVAPSGVLDFVLPLGATVVIHSLSVEQPCLIQAFETSARNDTNPYTFIATPDHLTDDGSSLMTDGTILRGRKYTVLTNMELVPSADQYFRVGNLSSTEVLNTVVHVDYLTLE